MSKNFGINTYHDEGIRDTEKRNSDFHQHFREPLFKLKENSEILEIASGSRADLLELAKFKSHNIYISDISLQALKNSKELINRNKTFGNITYLQADASNLPFPDNSLDAIFNCCSISPFRKSRKRTD